MQHDMKIIEIGDSPGGILPDEVVTALNVKAGDTVTFSFEADGCYSGAKRPDSADHPNDYSVLNSNGNHSTPSKE